MNRLLIDSSILLAHLRSGSTTAFLQQFPGSIISFATAAELLSLAETPSEKNQAKQLLGAFSCDWGSPEAHERALALVEEKNLSLTQAIEVGTAIAHNYTLATFNHRDYQNLPELKMVSTKSLPESL